MKIQISDETINKTTRCQKGFSCMSGTRTDMCKVELHNKELLITCLSDENCNYKTSVHDATYCACPTRKEIFECYKI